MKKSDILALGLILAFVTLVGFQLPKFFNSVEEKIQPLGEKEAQTVSETPKVDYLAPWITESDIPQGFCTSIERIGDQLVCFHSDEQSI